MSIASKTDKELMLIEDPDLDEEWVDTVGFVAHTGFMTVSGTSGSGFNKSLSIKRGMEGRGLAAGGSIIRVSR